MKAGILLKLKVVGSWEEQDSGVRILESGFRSQNEEHLLSAFRLPLTAYCPPPTAFCTRVEFELAGLLVRTADYDRMSMSKGKEKTSNFKK